MLFGLLAFSVYGPIHFHLLFHVYCSIISRILCHVSSLLMVSVQYMQRILSMAAVDNSALSWWSLFVFQVSSPYKKTALILEMKTLILVSLYATLQFQMFVLCTNIAMAVLVLTLTPSALPPCLSMMLPRYVSSNSGSTGPSPIRSPL